LSICALYNGRGFFCRSIFAFLNDWVFFFFLFLRLFGINYTSQLFDILKRDTSDLGLVFKRKAWLSKTKIFPR